MSFSFFDISLRNELVCVFSIKRKKFFLLSSFQQFCIQTFSPSSKEARGMLIVALLTCFFRTSVWFTSLEWKLGFLSFYSLLLLSKWIFFYLKNSIHHCYGEGRMLQNLGAFFNKQINKNKYKKPTRGCTKIKPIENILSTLKKISCLNFTYKLDEI
jgi:hypothetical protein